MVVRVGPSVREREGEGTYRTSSNNVRSMVSVMETMAMHARTKSFMWDVIRNSTGRYASSGETMRDRFGTTKATRYIRRITHSTAT